MQAQSTRARRPSGTGSLFVRTDRAGRRSWYGKFWSGGRQVKRKLGPVREPGTKVGLSRREAEKELACLRHEYGSLGPVQRMGLEEAAEEYLRHLGDVMQRKASTIADYRYMLSGHLLPFFGTRSLEAIDPDLVASYLHTKLAARYSHKTINNHLNFLHGLFRFAVKRRWVAANPVAAVDRPRPSVTEPDINYLTIEELDAVLRAVVEGEFAETDRTLFLAAAMSGLRQGELVALRWRDVDWIAGRIRVRRSYSRGEWGKPKSRRSSRSVPLADRLAGELETHFRRSAFQADDDLVFAHPSLGTVLDASRLRRRFSRAVEAAGVRRVRFHDLRHTFGTRMAAVGTPMRTLQEWMGHRDHTTTLVYADYAPDPTGSKNLVDRAFSPPSPAAVEPGLLGVGSGAHTQR